VTARHRATPATRPGRTIGAAGSGVLAFLLLVAALLVGPLPAGAATGTLMRLAQLTPDLEGVELTVSSVDDPRKTVMIAALGYGELSQYQALEPGDYVIAVRNPGSSEPSMIGRTLAVRPGTAYTVASVSAKSDDGLAVFTDDLTPPPPDRARVRVINAAPPAPVLDVQPLAPGLACGKASPYQEVAAGPLQLTIGPPGGSGTQVPVTLAANQVASVVLTARDAGTPQARVVVDAGGPAVVPPGPVHAGFGGMAGPRPGGAIGSIVLVLLAAVAGGVSVRLARPTA
jgi:Domain of unknown function (DUF4397)